jgi:integrase
MVHTGQLLHARSVTLQKFKVIKMAVFVKEKVKGSGVWWIFVDHNGKKTTRKIGKKSEAKKIKRELDSEFASQDKNEPGILFNAYAQIFIERFSKNHHAELSL